MVARRRRKQISERFLVGEARNWIIFSTFAAATRLIWRYKSKRHGETSVIHIYNERRLDEKSIIYIDVFVRDIGGKRGS